MLNVQLFIVNMIRENCYVVSDETNEAVIIDCGAIFPEECDCIKKYVAEKHLSLKHSLCTHGHFDHIFGTKFIYDTYGLKLELSVADIKLYNNCGEQLRLFLGEELEIETPPHGDFIGENSVIKFGSHAFTVLPTPGHTPGGISFYCEKENVVFTGDSIFRHSIGRTDFPYGDEELLLCKLCENIMTLPEDTKILPGHGHSTSVGEEKRENPFFTTMH